LESKKQLGRPQPQPVSYTVSHISLPPRNTVEMLFFPSLPRLTHLVHHWDDAQSTLKGQQEVGHSLGLHTLIGRLPWIHTCTKQHVK